jgi:hypothetical protein
MPDHAVTIHAYSYFYGTDGYYYLDDEKTKSVAVSNAWVMVATKEISASYDTPLDNNWYLAVTKTISVDYDVPLTGEWLLVATKSISVSYDVPMTGQWLLVATRNISVDYSGEVMSGDWLLVAQKVLEINKPGGTDENGEIPWGWIIGGIGGAAAVGGALWLMNDKKAVKSPQKAVQKKKSPTPY